MTCDHEWGDPRCSCVPADITRKRRFPPSPCLICGDASVVAKGRCQPCYRYLRRNGVDCPESLLIARAARDIAREHLRLLYIQS